MPCTQPIDVWPPRPNAPNRRPVFSSQASYAGAKPFQLSCGRCYSCRAAKAHDWGTRCRLELTEHAESMFITLTYAPQHLPKDYSVSYREIQLFMKRLRKHIADKHDDIKVRFIASGEYGGKTYRPHYHALIFGWRFTDGYEESTSKGNVLYASPTLDRLWGKGRANYGTGTEGVSHYVAGYTVKKLLLDRDTNAEFIDGATGEVHDNLNREKEFLTMSTKPGIGYNWFTKYREDLSKGFLMIDGQRTPIPRYFIKKINESDDELKYILQQTRRAYIQSKADEGHRLYQRHLLGLDALQNYERDKHL